MNGIGASPKESCGRSVMGTTPSLGNLGRNDLGLRVPVAKVREQLPSDVGHARALQELDLLSVHGHAGAARRARTVGRAVPETEHAAALDDRVVEQHAQVVHRYLFRSSGEFDAPSHASARSHQLLPRQGIDYLRQRRLGHPCRLGDLRDLQPRRSRPRDQSQTGCRDSNLSCEHGVVRWGVRAEQFASEDAIAGRHGIALDIRKTCAPECLCPKSIVHVISCRTLEPTDGLDGIHPKRICFGCLHDLWDARALLDATASHTRMFGPEARRGVARAA